LQNIQFDEYDIRLCPTNCEHGILYGIINCIRMAARLRSSLLFGDKAALISRRGKDHGAANAIH